MAKKIKRKRLKLNKNWYNYVDEIQGRGGYFNVYKGVQESTGNVVAIKRIKREMKEYAEASMTGYEKQILLNSSNYFPIIYDIDKMKNAVAEEWLSGKTLYKCLQEKAIHQEDKFHFMKILAYSVYLIHSLGFFHRDLHSGNISIDLSNKSLKIIDFNAAHSPEDFREVYKSPGVEIWGPNRDPALKKGDYLFDKKSDIYSLGIIFSEVIVGEHAKEWGFTADLEYDKFKENIKSKIKGECDAFLFNLIMDMISFEGILRPNISQIITALEIQDYKNDKYSEYSNKSRESGFAFLTKVGSRLELFLRERDVKKLSLLPRSQFDLKFFLFPDGSNDIKHMLLVPRRAVTAGTIIMFAELSIPNYPGALYDLIDFLYNKYSVIHVQSTEGFQSSPENKVFLILGQNVQTKSSDIHYYLNPLKQELVKFLFREIGEKYLEGNKEGIEIWEDWKSGRIYDSAIIVSGNLEKKFNGKIPYQQSVRGYLSSANHADPSHERYSVIKGFNISDRIKELDTLFGDKKIIMLKISTDDKQRDIALKVCNEGIHLARIQVRSILPTDYQLTFIHKIASVLQSDPWTKMSITWHIELFEIKDAIIRWNDGDRYTVRFSMYVTCAQEELQMPLDNIYQPIIDELYKILKALNGESNEVYISPIFNNNDSDLRFLNN